MPLRGGNLWWEAWRTRAKFSSDAQSCPILCNAMDHSTPGLPVHYQLSEFTQSHVHWGEGNGNPLQYSCLENPMDGGAWWASVHGVAQSWTQLKQFSMHAYTTGSEITHRILARTQIPLVITYTHTCNPLVQNHLEQCRPLLKFSLERESVTSHN